MEKSVALPNYTMVRTNTIGTLGELQQQAYSGSAAALTRVYQFDASTRIAQIERGDWSDNTKRVHNYDSRDRLMDYRDVRTWVETVWEPWDPYGDCPGCMIQTDITHVDTLRSAAYGYDKNGNPSGSGITVDALGNRLMVFGGETFTYDAEGNLLQRTGGAAGTVTYSWNGLGQLVQVVSSQGTTTYGYDGWGQRVRKTVNGVQTRYLLHGDQVVMEVSAANAVLAEYTYYPGTDRPHGMRRGGAQYYFAQDAQGNVYGPMNPNGSVAETYEYTPQGAPIGGGGGVGNPYRWKGREWDAEAGLYYVRARYYDPTVGRFISEDPIGPAGGFSVFAYGESDPVNASDPTGLCPCPHTLPPVYIIARAPIAWWTWDPWLMDFGSPVSVLNQRAEALGAIPVGDLSQSLSPSQKMQSCRLRMLPSSGTGYYTYGTPSNGFGQHGIADLRSVISLAGRLWARTGNPAFGVGNMSLPLGGHFPPHARNGGHSRGTSVDVRPIRTDNARVGGTVWTDRAYDRNRTQALVNIFLAIPDVERILFNDPNITGVSSAADHDNHLDIRVRTECGN